MREPVECFGTCGRKVRPCRTTKEQWPGTERWAGYGMCQDCLMVSGKHQTIPSPLPTFRPCETCGDLTRPKPMRAADAPEGSKVRIGGLCINCYENGVRVTPERVAYIRRELDSYLRSRGRVDTKLKEAS